VVESDVGCCAGVVVCREDGFCLEFTKSVEIELSGEGGEVGVFEVLGEDVAGEFFDVFDDKALPVVCPYCYICITPVDHVECFCEEHG